jgi:hypothetical protein
MVMIKYQQHLLLQLSNLSIEILNSLVLALDDLLQCLNLIGISIVHLLLRFSQSKDIVFELLDVLA